jgi:hypothetical protein
MNGIKKKATDKTMPIIDKIKKIKMKIFTLFLNL